MPGPSMFSDTGTRNPVRAMAFGLAVLMLAAGCAAQSVERSVKDLISKAKLNGLKVGISIVDCPTGEKLASIDDKAPMMPASNLKVLTTGTALIVLGADYKFKTRLIRDGDRLVIVGSGDPALAEPKLLSEMQSTVAAFLDQLATSVKASGFTGIREIVIDDRIFDRDGIHPTWPKNQLKDWYCAPVSGLNFHANLLEVYCSAASKPGPSPMPRTEPTAPWIEVVNNLVTVSTGNNLIDIVREGQNETRFKIQGSIRNTPAEPLNITLNQSSLVFGRLLGDRLKALGLTSEKRDPNVRLAEIDDVFNEKDVVAEVVTPLSRILKRCNTDSYNLYADALLKRVGHDVTGQPGSWSNGATVVRMTLDDKVKGVAADLTIADGSGLSRDNRVTALMMAQWMRALDRTPGVGDAFEASLAHIGEGTFRARFKNRRMTGEVSGKSGFINGVQCLSGYLTHPKTKRRVAYSILVNDIGKVAGTGNIKDFHEDVVMAIDQWLAKNPGVERAAK